MSHVLKEENVPDLIKQLVTRITQSQVRCNITKNSVVLLYFPQENAERFKYYENFVINKLRASDTMYFVNKKDIDQNIEGLFDKFCFHGFLNEANDLKRMYVKFFEGIVVKNDIEVRLNIIRLFLCLSKSPTNSFVYKPKPNLPIKEDDEIDWASYLMEDVQRWSPPSTDSDVRNLVWYDVLVKVLLAR